MYAGAVEPRIAGIIVNLSPVSFVAVTEKPAHVERAFHSILLISKDRIFGCFSNAELDNLLRRNLDGLARLGVSSHAGFSLNQNESTEGSSDCCKERELPCFRKNSIRYPDKVCYHVLTMRLEPSLKLR